MKVYSERITHRIVQIFNELQASCDTGLDFHDRLREFHSFCINTPEINALLQELPDASHDFKVDWRQMPDYWPPGRKGYSTRWDAIVQMVNGGSSKVDEAWFQISVQSQAQGLAKICEIFILPVANFIMDQLEYSGQILHLLLRYKRWAEWFNSQQLRDLYDSTSKGEDVLDQNLRKFLFESGVDYPFSQPESPGGKADIIAGLESQDPLVLEIKIWDSSKGYKESRIRDGLRQVIDYASKYGKDRGYLAVFNLDEHPLVFESSIDQGLWPPRLEHGGRIYYFVDIHIGEIKKPISAKDKGKVVSSIRIRLEDLLES